MTNEDLTPLLNSRQQQAIRFGGGPLIIAAGPGTGKTRVLTHRIAHLLVEKQIPPENILAVTFTKSAANEMRQRLELLLGEGVRSSSLGKGQSPAGTVPKDEDLTPSPWIVTFHALALKILREENYPFGPGIEWSVANDENKRLALKGVVEGREISAFLDEIRKQKSALALPGDGTASQYQKNLLAAKRLDFDDLILYAWRLFEEKPEVLEKYHQRFGHILVDEFQDTSFAQYQLLIRFKCPNLCVIGDPDQAIYGFAGNGVRSELPFSPFEEFKKDHPDHNLIVLAENYRSQAGIVEAAGQVIRKNPSRLPRELLARLEKGLPIEITSYSTDRQEAQMIAQKIENLLGGTNRLAIESRADVTAPQESLYGLEDIVILYRLHTQARLVAEALGRAGLPFQVFQKIKDEAPSAAEDLEDFQNNETGFIRGKKITLMTLHRAKGLEFPVVFIIGCEGGIVPCDILKNASDIEEERRLFYVGMTRAKERLIISCAKKRFIFGKTLKAGPSPFLSDIEEKLRVLGRGPSFKKRQPQIKQPTLFKL